MRFTKLFIFLTLSLAIGFLGCTKDQKSEIPKIEQITKNLVPPKVEIKGQIFGVEINDLKVTMTVKTDSKEIVETPSLSGSIKITNKTKGNRLMRILKAIPEDKKKPLSSLNFFRACQRRPKSLGTFLSPVNFMSQSLF